MEDAHVEKSKAKKAKKSKKQVVMTPQESDDEAEQPEIHELPAKKRKRQAGINDETVVPIPAAEVAAPDVVPTSEKSKKRAKKDKKAKKGKSASNTDAPAQTEDKKSTAANTAENWNVQNLDGGANRQAKFMRLLGAKKSGQAAGSGVKPRDHLDMKHVADDLEKQFEAGRFMKHEAGGQKRGLGA